MCITLLVYGVEKKQFLNKFVHVKMLSRTKQEKEMRKKNVVVRGAHLKQMRSTNQMLGEFRAQRISL